MSQPSPILIVISAYNYAEYLPACLDAVLAQTFAHFSCLVVDDGSTDATAAVGEQYALRDPRIRVLAQPNQGQLSVFNAAAELCQDNQWVCFLDADDVWSPRYLETVVAASAGDLKRCDFLFTRHQSLDPQHLAPATSGEPHKLVDLGITSGVTRAFLLWIGNVTSTVSLRGSLLKRILPYPYLAEWRVRADDLLVIGASIAGVRKGWIDAPLVYYRQHGSNNYAGREKQHRGEPDRILALERFVTWICQREALCRVPSPLLVERELANFGLWSPHDLVGCRARSALLIRDWPLLKRFKIYRRIWKELRAVPA